MCGTRGPAVHHGWRSRPAPCLIRPAPCLIRQPEARHLQARLRRRHPRRCAERGGARSERALGRLDEWQPAREERPGRAPPSRSAAESNLASLTRLAGTDLPTGIGAARAPRATARARHGRCRSAPGSSARPPTRSPAAATRPPTTDIVCFTSGCCTQSCPRTGPCPRGWQPQGGHCVSGADDEHTKYVSYRARVLMPVCCQAQRTQGYPARTVEMAVANVRGVSFT